MEKKITKVQVIKALKKVIDPELNISIVDLGLVYTVVFEKDKTVHITMTLTTIGCPLFSLIEQDVRDKIKALGVAENKIRIDLLFDPPWSIEKMSESAKAILGI